MLITIKDSQTKIFFKIEIDEERAGKIMMRKLLKREGNDNFPVLAGQKLIYAGKILDDSKSLKEYKIEDGKFIVAMVTKPKSVSLLHPPTRTLKLQLPRQPVHKKSNQPNQPAVESTTSSSPAEEQASSAAPLNVSQAESTLVTAKLIMNLVTSIMAMGFGVNELCRRTNASFCNPDRAVEYLMSGNYQWCTFNIKIFLYSVGTAPPQQQPDTIPTENAPISDSNVFNDLMDNPEIQVMAQQIQQNPHLLQPYLQQIEQSNPSLFNMVSSHPEEFVSFLTTLRRGTSQSQPPPASAGAGGVSYVRVTAGEQQDIEQVFYNDFKFKCLAKMPNDTSGFTKSLGFSESECVQAYMACDKNLDMAANFLLSDIFKNISDIIKCSDSSFTLHDCYF
ncbi:LOW QUALITY PROTEIN: UV excision repair protein RAD23 homolog A-like [Ciona intestinalis]